MPRGPVLCIPQKANRFWSIHVVKRVFVCNIPAAVDFTFSLVKDQQERALAI